MIPGQLVDDAVADAEREVRQNTISRLNTHQRALYEVLAEEDGFIQKGLYARYQGAHDDPVTLRYLQRTTYRSWNTILSVGTLDTLEQQVPV